MVGCRDGPWRSRKIEPPIFITGIPGLIVLAPAVAVAYVRFRPGYRGRGALLWPLAVAGPVAGGWAPGFPRRRGPFLARRRPTAKVLWGRERESSPRPPWTAPLRAREHGGGVAPGRR